MKRKTLVLLAVVALVAAKSPEGDANKKDLDKMQGDWAAVSMVNDGAKASDDEAQCLFRTVKGQQHTLYLYNKPLMKGRFKIDATKKPKTIDLVITTGFGKGQPILGIYELDGDRWKICNAGPGKERPKDFSAKKGSGHTLVLWEREKK
jgi:uncharacterized protein (TIGR03067 family)